MLVSPPLALLASHSSASALTPVLFHTRIAVPDQSKNPDPAQIYEQGFEYLAREFPDLSYIRTCVIKGEVEAIAIEDHEDDI
jgi:hypothetical protein